MVKPAGGSCVVSHSAIALAGSTAVLICATEKPSRHCVRLVMTSSARDALPQLITRRCSVGSIQTAMREKRAKAIGSSSCVMSSFRSRFSFLPGLRPVVASICAQRSSSLRRTTEPGTALVSTMNSTTHCPPTDSTSGPCS